MKEACEIFISLCQSDDRPAAVAALSHAELIALRGLLSRIYEENDTSGEILGLCLVEEAGRFESMMKDLPK